MAAKAERFPVLNTMRFIKAFDSLGENINTWSQDRGFFADHIRSWQDGNSYEQKKNVTDKLDIYLDSLADELCLHVYNENAEVVASVTIFSAAILVAGNTKTLGGVVYPYRSYYVSFDLGDVYTMTDSQQVLWFAIECLYGSVGDPGNTWHISEPQFFRESGWPDTMLVEATNSLNEYDVAFEQFAGDNIAFAHRVEACMSDDPPPAFDDIVFKSQRSVMRKLKSVPYDLFEFIVGGEEGGVPKYMLRKINRALSCDNFTIDGVRYVKDSGAAWSMSTADDYLKYSGKIRLQEYEHDQGTETDNTDEGDFEYHDDYHDDSHD